MIIVMGHAKLASGEIDRLLPDLTAMVTATNAEDGCDYYNFSRDLADPDTMIVSERWRDQAAIDAHFASPHMAIFNKALASATVLSLSVKAYENDTVRTLMGS